MAAFAGNTAHDMFVTSWWTERQHSVNSFWSCIFGNQVITCIYRLITQQLTALIGKNTIYTRKNMDSKIIDIAICKTCKKWLLNIESVVMIRYYYQTAKTRALYESTDGPAWQPTYSPPNSDWLGDVHWTVPQLTVRVCGQHRQPILQQFGSTWDLYQMRQSKTVDISNNSLWLKYGD